MGIFDNFTLKSLLYTVLIFALYLTVFTNNVESLEEGNRCEHFNQSCISCTDQSSCFWCGSTQSCGHYKLIPKGCSKAQWYVKQCTIAGYWLIIVLPCVAVFLLISFVCCCWCYCRRSKSSIDEKYKMKESRRQKEKDQRRNYFESKNADREVERERIREKYGLFANTSDGEAKRFGKGSSDRSPLLK